MARYRPLSANPGLGAHRLPGACAARCGRAVDVREDCAPKVLATQTTTLSPSRRLGFALPLAGPDRVRATFSQTMIPHTHVHIIRKEG